MALDFNNSGDVVDSLSIFIILSGLLVTSVTGIDGDFV